MSTTDAVSQPLSPSDFFARLAAEPQPLLAGTEGTLRFDAVRGDATSSWYLRIDRGTVAVSHENGPADAVIRVNEPMFEDMVSGRANAMAAALRGDIHVEGSPQLLTIFQRLFPGPPQVSAS